MHSDPLLHSVILLTSFALWLTSHLSLAWGIARRHSPRWHGLVVLLPVVAWLAPYWGFREGMALRASIWCLSLGAYIISLWAALA